MGQFNPFNGQQSELQQAEAQQAKAQQADLQVIGGLPLQPRGNSTSPNFERCAAGLSPQSSGNNTSPNFEFPDDAHADNPGLPPTTGNAARHRNVVADLITATGDLHFTSPGNTTALGIRHVHERGDCRVTLFKDDLLEG